MNEEEALKAALNTLYDSLSRTSEESKSEVYFFRGFYIPDRMMQGIERYVKHYVRPGGFLQAVICNDLKESVGRADDTNMRNLPAYVSYFYNEAPGNCWGSLERMEAWLKKGIEDEKV